MHVYKVNNESLAQYTIRISMGTNAVFEEIAAEGQYPSVNELIESMLLEFALDALAERKRNRAVRVA